MFKWFLSVRFDVRDTELRVMVLRLFDAPSGDPGHLFMAHSFFKGDGAW